MQILGVRKSRLQKYVVDGLVIPAQDSDGPGTDRLYSARNVAEFAAAIVFFRYGLNVDIVKHILSWAREIDQIWEAEGKASLLDPLRLPESATLVSVELSEKGVEPVTMFHVTKDEGKYFDLFDDRPVAQSWGAIVLNLTRISVGAGLAIAEYLKSNEK